MTDQDKRISKLLSKNMSMFCSPSGSSVHGVLQARILEWVAIPFSRESSWPRDQTQISCIPGKFFTVWAHQGSPACKLNSLTCQTFANPLNTIFQMNNKKPNSKISSDPMDVGNLISGSSTFSKSSFNIWKFMVHVLLKPSLENFEHYFPSMWDECNCVVVWTFFGIAFLWDWNENWPFPVSLVATPEFSKFAGILNAPLSQHHLLWFEIAQLESITSTSFVHSDAS